MAGHGVRGVYKDRTSCPHTFLFTHPINLGRGVYIRLCRGEIYAGTKDGWLAWMAGCMRRRNLEGQGRKNKRPTVSTPTVTQEEDR